MDAEGLWDYRPEQREKGKCCTVLPESDQSNQSEMKPEPEPVR